MDTGQILTTTAALLAVLMSVVVFIWQIARSNKQDRREKRLDSTYDIARLQEQINQLRTDLRQSERREEQLEQRILKETQATEHIAEMRRKINDIQSQLRDFDDAVKVTKELHAMVARLSSKLISVMRNHND